MTDPTATNRVNAKSSGTGGTTGTIQCLQGLTWSRLRKSDWGHWVQHTKTETGNRQAVPAVPVGNAELGPDNLLVSLDGPSGPTGPSREMAGANEILNLLRSAETVSEVEAIMAEYNEAIEAIAALPDPMESVRAIHIRNLARHRDFCM